ncbi:MULTISPECIES: SUF system Fe-S cluster assembly regulator [Sphingosinicellaceae]|uniref:SUF system Fe-S cluster assembly regulator n=1 Tax=Sphingosinicellaceae TaxID=2820280 RepID=UPI001C1E38DB|nr:MULTISPECIES: SUF system Fe-S cluster assembly regulator [Polymorphobacter]QYE35530.1 SUF system Fe-S cluster assembly regulator [Polymorphobacter sp. PAMC 29334]UAJ11158.1 SUF system Fe-S cluster assembly regulator [Polymorphobacter megasporae]
MLRLTNLADYSVVVMTAAARSPDCCLSAAAVAARTGIPAPTVAKVMGLLKRAGLLASSRGVAGGFRLARETAAISVADIVEAVDGPIALTNCQHGEVSACALEGSCAVRPHWRPINVAVRAALAAVTLADLAGPVAQVAMAQIEVVA